MADSAPDLEHPAFRPIDVQHAHDEGGIVLIDRLGLSEPTFVPAAMLPVLGQFDGVRDLAAIAAAASAQLGETVGIDLVRELVHQLDQRLLLVSENFQTRLEAEIRGFLGRDVRPCRHAGSAGYHRDPARLCADLDAMLPALPGEAPPLRGLIAPHIDLARGRRGYAAAYGALLAHRPADLYVVFGTGHMGPGAPVTGLHLDWQTPLGRVPTDRGFVDAVHAALGEPAAFDQFLHRDEHALEFQVLMLQHVHQRRGGKPFEVAAFLCGGLPSATGDPDAEAYVQHLIAAFRTAAAQGGKQVCFLAGADLAHLGPFFGDATPVGPPLLQRLDADERRRLDWLQRGQPGRFHLAVARGGNPDRVCSATSMYLTAKLAGGDAELLHYGQAAADDGAQVVTFPALQFG